jgi:hypothetical protein
MSARWSDCFCQVGAAERGIGSKTSKAEVMIWQGYTLRVRFSAFAYYLVIPSPPTGPSQCDKASSSLVMLLAFRSCQSSPQNGPGSGQDCLAPHNLVPSLRPPSRFARSALIRKPSC